MEKKYKELIKVLEPLNDGIKLTNPIHENTLNQQYYGEFDEKKGLKHGRGIWKCQDGFYEGYFCKGYANGKGILKSSDSIFKGEFKGGEKFFGEELFNDGIKFNGKYHKDQFLNGKIIYSDNSVYEGSFKNNLKDGEGKYVYYRAKKKEIYIGHWKNDLRDGKGVCTFGNGDIFDGLWINGKMAEHGKYYISKEKKWIELPV